MHSRGQQHFQKEADKAKDADVKNFAANTLPILQEHPRVAEETDAAVGGKAAGGKKKTAMR